MMMVVYVLHDIVGGEEHIDVVVWNARLVAKRLEKERDATEKWRFIAEIHLK